MIVSIKPKPAVALPALCLFLLLILQPFETAAQKQSGKSAKGPRIRTLIVFFDGLRPDYITPELMPNLSAFKKAGGYGDRHHSVFPTVTRVNSSSLATGCYPERTGLMGNTVYFPQVNRVKGLNTGDAANLLKINDATGGKLLTAVSLGEILQAAGEKMMVFSSGSSGQAFLQNHTVGSGAVVNTSLILPSSFEKTVVDAAGPIPANARPNAAQHKWITDALIRFGFATDGPLVSAIWFSDPDGAAHTSGIGSLDAKAALRSVDGQFARIVKVLQEKGLANQFNIIISTDHGFVTHVGKQDLTQFLIKEGLKKDTASQDVIVAEGAIYVKDHDVALIKKIVGALQPQPWVGAIFTRSASPGSLTGFVKGTLSFESIHWNHASRAADLLVDESWNDSTNSAGYAGTSHAKGVAGHGGMSPYEVHIPLILSGPSFKSSFVSELPSSNVDIAPTILRLHNIAAPPTMEGRVLSEFFKGTKVASPQGKSEIVKVESKGTWGKYTLTLKRVLYANKAYVEEAKVEREIIGQ